MNSLRSKVRSLKNPEGILKMPLLRQALIDSQVNISFRLIDANWSYEKIITGSVAGFNPFHKTIYLAQNSAMARWLKDGMTNDRNYNEGDFLVKEALFFIHDYLHVWSCMAIQDELPDLKFAYGEINEKNIDSFIFCYLLTEVAATIGLDYWYLSTIELDQICKLGTNYETLTVTYHEKNNSEYRTFNKNLNVQSPEMFNTLAQFYCTGEFPGFSLKDLKKSPKIQTWLTHELAYGEKQREYTRSWLSYLSNGKITFKPETLRQGIPINKPWQKVLIKKISKRLWDLVKNGESKSFKSSTGKTTWSQKQSLVPDFRFTNLNSINFDPYKMLPTVPRYAENFGYFFSQFISSYSFATFPSKLLIPMEYIRKERDLAHLLHLVKMSGAKKLTSKHQKEPVDLFFIN